MSITDALTSKRNSDSVIAAEYAAEYASGHEQAAMCIWWALMCGRAPDALQYSYRPGVSAVWVNDADMCGLGGPIARTEEHADLSWITRENARLQIQRDADREREAAEFEARVSAQCLHWVEDKV